MKSISWDFWDQGEIMHKRDQCRPCWPGVSDIGHRAGAGFPEYSTKWEEDATPFDYMLRLLSLDQFSSVAQSCPTLCNLMNRSMPGLPVHKYVCVHIYIYVFLPGEFYGQKSLADYSPWGHKQWDMTEQVTHHVKGTFKGESGNRNTSALNGKVPFSSSCHSTLHSQWKISGHAKPRQC